MQTEQSKRTLLHVSEAARQIDVSPWTIRRAIASGELEAVRIGTRGNYRIRVGDLDRFLTRAEPKP